MVYMDSDIIGTKLLIDAWIKNDLIQLISNHKHIQLINSLFNWLIDPCLDFVINNCEQFINCSKMHLVISFLKLFKSLLSEIE